MTAGLRTKRLPRAALAAAFLLPLTTIRGHGASWVIPPDAIRPVTITLTIPRITLAAPIYVTPRVLEKGSQGVPVTVTVWLPSEQIAKQVVPETVVLNDTVPQMRYRGLPKLAVPPDGRRCLFAFDRQAVARVLPVGLRVEVTVSGELRSRHYFRGTDAIAVIQMPPGDGK